MAKFGRDYVARKIVKGLEKTDGIRLGEREVEKIGFIEVYDWCNTRGFVVHHIYAYNPESNRHVHTTTIITKNWAYLIAALKNIEQEFSQAAVVHHDQPIYAEVANKFREEYTHLLQLRESGLLSDPVRSVFNGQYSRQSPGEEYWRNRREHSREDRRRIGSMVGQSAT